MPDLAASRPRPTSAPARRWWLLRWRARTVLRGRARLLLALLAALAAGVAASSGRGAGPPSVAVPVAAADLPAGHRLTVADLRTARWPPGTAPPSALPTRSLVGRVLSAAVRAGETVPLVRLQGSGLAAAAGPGRVAVPVPVPAAAARLLGVGDLVDLVQGGGGPSAVTSGPGVGADVDVGAPAGSAGAAPGAAVPGDLVLARAARVLGSAAPPGSTGLLTGGADADPVLVVAVTPAEAPALASAAAGGPLWPVLRSP